jgi:hypothetical protein
VCEICGVEYVEWNLVELHGMILPLLYLFFESMGYLLFPFFAMPFWHAFLFLIFLPCHLACFSFSFCIAHASTSKIFGEGIREHEVYFCGMDDGMVLLTPSVGIASERWSVCESRS